MRLRADLRPGRQVGVRMPVGLGLFRRCAAFTRTWHGSESKEPASEIKGQLAQPSRRCPGETPAGPGSGVISQRTGELPAGDPLVIPPQPVQLRLAVLVSG